jgi:hypothetical protein
MTRLAVICEGPTEEGFVKKCLAPHLLVHAVLRPRVLRRPGPASAFLGRPDAAQVPGPPAGRDHQARHHRRAAPRASSTGRSLRPLLRHALAGQRQGAERTRANRFSVTRQLRYSRDETQLALDLCALHQRPAGRHLRAEEQPDQADGRGRRRAVQARPRPAREAVRVRPLRGALRGGRPRGALLHRTSRARGSWFLPFNQGWNDGAGNPPNPDGLKTDYLWKRILTPAGLTDILENYAQIVEIKDEKTGKKKQVQIWPRYHQLDVVRKLLADAARTAPASAT